ncbi:hypothetical protein BGZ76_001999 [Entomortierella beljakovae]|nr:hypothetical protein BGZ76_001999 [Entomortierella beljakovae]
MASRGLKSVLNVHATDMTSHNILRMSGLSLSIVVTLIFAATIINLACVAAYPMPARYELPVESAYEKPQAESSTQALERRQLLANFFGITQGSPGGGRL